VAGFGAVYAAAGLGSAVALIPAGMLVDRVGAGPVLVIGGIVNGLGTLVAGAMTSPVAFSAALLLAGIGGAAVPVAGMTSLMRVFSPERRGVVMGWRQLAVPLGGTIGAVVLPLLTGVGGVPLALAACGVATMATSIAFGMVLGPETGEVAAPVRGGVAAMLRSPGIRPALTVGLVYIVGLTSVLTYYIPAARAAGFTHTQAAVGFVVVNVVAGLSRPLWGRRADADGGTRRARTLRDTGIVATVGAALILPALHAGPGPGLAATALLAFGTFGFNGILYVTVGELAGPARAGVGVGAASTVVFGMGAVVAPVAGLAIEQLGYGVLWAIAGVAGALGAAIAWRFLPSGRTAAAAPIAAPAAGCGDG
jgi:MFS family permease